MVSVCHTKAKDIVMRGKKKDAGSEAVLTFRLPRELHQRLVEASGERSLSEEMRGRLEASFVAPPTDAETHQFIEAIATMTDFLAGRKRRWHADPTAFAILREALEIVIEAFRPSGEPEPGDFTAWVGLLAGMALHDLPDERADRAMLSLDKREPKHA
jgi:hypothetical protein